MVKKALLCLSLCVVAAIATRPAPSHGSSQQPPLARTGAPGETSCASSGCHAGVATQNSSFVTIDVGGGLTSYQAGQTYQITVSNSDTGSKYGFQMVALDASNNSVGTFIGDAAQHTNVATSSSNGRTYVRHFNAHTAPVYTFQWTAPATNVGTITFYIASNAANGNGMGTGDKIHLKATTLDFSTAIGETPAAQSKASQLLAYPNPATDNAVSLAFRLSEAQDLRLEIYDMSGKLMNQQDLGLHEPGSQTTELDLDRSQYSAGNYMVRLSGKSYSQTCQITLQ